MISTNNTNANYLIRKKEIEDSIAWYNKTINAVEEQQSKRRRTLYELEEQLYKLEREYYGA